MAEWRQSLADVDEDYLVGISNRGIVKRAYKDLEAEGVKAQEAAKGIDLGAEELSVTAGDETVTLRLPLAESRCSCPSRSICRHVVMAVLIAKQAAAATGESEDAGSLKDSGGNSGAEGHENSGGRSGTEGMENSGSRPGTEEMENGGSRPGTKGTENGGSRPGTKGTENGGSAGMKGKGNGSLSEKVWQEILAQPLKPLLRALGSRGLRRLAAMMKAGQVPEVERGSTVRMALPGQDIAVKLLSPLEYSTCSCHKKELCSHKAEAILWCQYLEKQLTAQDLIQESERQPDLDLEELREAAEQIGNCLEHLLETGLARSGPEQAQEMERLAILCHNAGLPGWEGELRALAEGYEKYLRRTAGQTMEKLAGQLQRLYDKTVELKALAESAIGGLPSGQGEQTDPAKEGRTGSCESPVGRIQALAGEFRSEYLPAGDLELTGITMEHFVSDSGYEGDTVYFLDEAAGRWYTYTNARPTFYDGKKRKGNQEKAPAPWGIAQPLESLARMRLLLRGAKCDAQGRLSSTQETRGEILGKSELTASCLKGWYYREYDRLFAEQIPKPGDSPQTGHPRLVFVQAADFERGSFNKVTQKLELSVWDRAGRQVLVELPYTRREESSIRYLERMKTNQAPCFLGRVYLQGSQVCLYPVDVLERQELEQVEKIDGDSNRKQENIKNDSCDADFAKAASQEACQALQSYLEEVSWLLQTVYQVGCATVQDSTLEALRQAQKQGETYGMTTLSDWLRQLEEQLSEFRHRLKNSPSKVMRIYCGLWRYVGLCRRRIAYDLAGIRYLPS